MQIVRTIARGLLLTAVPPIVAINVAQFAFDFGGAESRCMASLEQAMDIHDNPVICTGGVGFLFNVLVFSVMHLLIVLPLILLVVRGVRTGRLSSKAPRRVVIAVTVAIGVLVCLLVIKDAKFGIIGALWGTAGEFGLPVILLFALAMGFAVLPWDRSLPLTRA